MTDPKVLHHTGGVGGQPEAGVPARYAGEWALFRDWCAVAGRSALPADASDMEAFLVGCPAAPATVARRLTAIAAVHRATGLAPPERTDAVRDAARGRPARPVRQPIDPDRLDEALRVLPSHGWPAGWFGRRDRALLVLAGVGLPYRAVARLVAGDIGVREGIGYVSLDEASVTVRGDNDPIACRPCAMVRWLRVLELAITRVSIRPVAAMLARAAPLTRESLHLCRSRTATLSDAAGSAPLLPPIDRWGYPSGEVVSLTAASLSHLARNTAAGFRASHQGLTFEPEHPAADEPLALPWSESDVAEYSLDRWKAGVERRQDALGQLRSLDRTLDDLDARAGELERRTVELLAQS